MSEFKQRHTEPRNQNYILFPISKYIGIASKIHSRRAISDDNKLKHKETK